MDIRDKLSPSSSQMEWLHQNTLLGDEDLNVFRFKAGECVILELSRQLDVCQPEKGPPSLYRANRSIDGIETVKFTLQSIEIGGRLEGLV